jgi:crossover junction endodeoxyribonuclease RuvC
MKVLGIDPGTARLGWGVLDYADNAFKVYGHGCIETPAKNNDSERLTQIEDELTAVIEKYKPDALAIEELFFARNVSSAMSVAQARGVVLLVGQRYKLQVIELKPSQVKQAVTGIGNADKAQVQRMVEIMLDLKHAPKLDDTADALACAIAGSGNQVIK